MTNLKTSILLSFLFVVLLSFPSYAYFVDVEQYETLNKSTAYINEFMSCYFTNGTHLLWDTYNGGVASIVTPNSTFSYELYCCDNCLITDTVQLTPNSLNYLLDGNITIDQDYTLQYYVGDILEEYRVTLLATRSDVPSNNKNDMAGYLIILIATIGFPLIGTNLYPSVPTAKMIGAMGTLGFLIGIGGAKFYNLLNLGQTLMTLGFGIIVMIAFVKLSGGNS